jgi:hypothetical protein
MIRNDIDDEMRAELAKTLRKLADDLEADDVRLAGPTRVSYVDTASGLPAELEIRYFDLDAGRERTIEVY